ncbi:MAG: putative ABC transport system permease protein, partial [Kiritimatiellia bacterium]
GEWVDIKGISYRVVGEFHDEGGLGELQKVYVPITTAQTAYGGGDTVHMIMFTVGDLSVDQSNELVDQVRHQLASVHHFDPQDRRALRIRNNLEKFQEIGDVLDMIRIFSWIVGLGTIAAGVVGVGNIMLVSVSERTSEIGLRKALGATPFSVVAQIVFESLLLTSVAGYAGLIAGLVVVELADRFLPATEMFRDPEVDLGMAFGAVGVLVLSGLVAGFVPAWRAARVDPVVALREGG